MSSRISVILPRHLVSVAISRKRFTLKVSNGEHTGKFDVMRYHTGTVLSIFGLTCLGAATRADATFHTWRISQVFSDSSGNVQFIEFHEAFGDANEQFLGGRTLIGTSTFTFGGNLPTPSNSANRFFLIGTAAYAALSGAVTPDYSIPSGFLALGGGTLNFAGGIDTVTYGALPTDGITSLGRVGTTGSNFSSRANLESNYAGTRGSVTVPAPSVALIAPLALVAAARRRRA